jgi:RNA-splicing ligase RtcB
MRTCYRTFESDGSIICSSIESVHNYIDLKSNIIRKGAISAKEGEDVIIPLNMRDGSILGVGKGKEAWNYSAPHGAGRISSRKAVKERYADGGDLSYEDFKKDMSGIVSNISPKLVDESPAAYKESSKIIEAISDTVDIKHRIRPIFNYKN